MPRRSDALDRRRLGRRRAADRVLLEVSTCSPSVQRPIQDASTAAVGEQGDGRPALRKQAEERPLTVDQPVPTPCVVRHPVEARPSQAPRVEPAVDAHLRVYLAQCRQLGFFEVPPGQPQQVGSRRHGGRPGRGVGARGHGHHGDRACCGVLVSGRAARGPRDVVRRVPQAAQPAPHGLLPGQAGHGLDHASEQAPPRIAVGPGTTRRTSRHIARAEVRDQSAQGIGVVLRSPLEVELQGSPQWDVRPVRHHGAHRRPAGPVELLDLGHVRRDGIVQRQAPLGHKPGDDRRDHRLGERADGERGRRGRGHPGPEVGYPVGRDVVVAVMEQADHRSRDSGRGGVLAEQVRQAGRHHRTRLGPPSDLANHPPTTRS